MINRINKQELNQKKLSISPDIEIIIQCTLVKVHKSLEFFELSEEKIDNIFKIGKGLGLSYIKIILRSTILQEIQKQYKEEERVILEQNKELNSIYMDNIYKIKQFEYINARFSQIIEGNEQDEIKQKKTENEQEIKNIEHNNLFLWNEIQLLLIKKQTLLEKKQKQLVEMESIMEDFDLMIKEENAISLRVKNSMRSKINNLLEKIKQFLYI